MRERVSQGVNGGEDHGADAPREHRIAAAGLDVSTAGPLPAGRPLLMFQNAVFSPHLGGSTKQCDTVLVEGALGVLGAP